MVIQCFVALVYGVVAFIIYLIITKLQERKIRKYFNEQNKLINVNLLKLHNNH